MTLGDLSGAPASGLVICYHRFPYVKGTDTERPRWEQVVSVWGTVWNVSFGPSYTRLTLT